MKHYKFFGLNRCKYFKVEKLTSHLGLMLTSNSMPARRVVRMITFINYQHHFLPPEKYLDEGSKKKMNGL